MSHNGNHTAIHHGSDLPARGAPIPPPPPVDNIAADVRIQAVNRLRTMNGLHAAAAWNQRRRDPLAPYAVAFLFVFPDPRRPQRFAVAAATRLFLAGPETEQLPRLLFTLDRHAKALTGDGPFDIRTALANRADPMPDDAQYAGVAVSTLDTHDGAWQQVCQRDIGVLDIPGRTLTVLTDGTLIVSERRGLNEYNTFHVTSNRSHEIAAGRTLYPCSPATSDQLTGDPDDADVWRFLQQLNDTLWQADNTRLTAISDRTQGGRRAR